MTALEKGDNRAAGQPGDVAAKHQGPTVISTEGNFVQSPVWSKWRWLKIIGVIEVGLMGPSWSMSVASLGTIGSIME
jgi:hypothetical protein